MWRKPFLLCAKRSFESWKWYVTPSMGCFLLETVAMEIAFYVYFHWLQ